MAFFKSRGHAVIPSASLIPEGDSTLLFVNSGMFPLVPYLMGQKHPEGTRLADSQKCIRTGDIEEVGDNRHLTFFEMLGNWSLGDYFKRDQLAWWYEFLVQEIGLDPSRLYATVYGGSSIAPKDEESIRILKEIFASYAIEAEEGPSAPEGSDMPSEAPDFSSRQRIFPYVEKNWWQRGDAVGELGGPDSETHYDTGRPHDPAFGPFCHVNCDCGRFIEIGNSVFMQYQMTESGWKEMKQQNVDFGGGLERIVMIKQGAENVFETDLFLPLIRRIEELSGAVYGEHERAFRIIADHVKAASFVIADPRGVEPSNGGQGYIVRRLIRRALRYGTQIGITHREWMSSVAEAVAETYGNQYAELRENRELLVRTLDAEEERFRTTLERGLREFEVYAARGRIAGKEAFDLYQTYGFPIEMTRELALERGLDLDEHGFREAALRHQERSRTASSGMFKGGLADHSEEVTKLHTATHLLLAALRKVLGEHVTQKGSNITAERLRLDIPHAVKMTEEEIGDVENLVNDAISRNLPVSWKEMPLEDARAIGAVGAFGERYGERVKVYTIGNDQDPFSREICGGPHVDRTGALGNFSIVKEEAVGANTRRLKAVLKNT